MKFKIVRYLALPIVLTAFLAGCSDDQEEEKVVATVGNIEITEQQFEQALKQQYGSEMIEQLMANEIVRLEAKEKNLEITPAEVDEEYAIYAESYGGEEALLESFKQYNLKEEDIRKDIEIYLLTYKVLEQAIDISDEEVIDYYETNKEYFVDENGEALPYEQVQAMIETEILQERVDAEYPNWLEEMFEKYDAKNKIFE